MNNAGSLRSNKVVIYIRLLYLLVFILYETKLQFSYYFLILNRKP